MTSSEKPFFILVPGIAPDIAPMLPLKKYLEDLGYEAAVTNFWGDRDLNDFTKLTIADCQQGIRDIVRRAREDHPFVVGIGISLGGALLIEDAKNHSDIDYIISVGTPAKLKKRFWITLGFLVLPIFYPMWKRLQKNRKLRMFPVGAAKIVIRYVEGDFRKNLDKVRTPILFIHSKHDIVTDYQALGKLTDEFKNCHHETLIVENLNHVLEYDEAIIIRNAFKFLNAGSVKKQKISPVEATSFESEAETIHAK